MGIWDIYGEIAEDNIFGWCACPLLTLLGLTQRPPVVFGSHGSKITKPSENNRKTILRWAMGHGIN